MTRDAWKLGFVRRCPRFFVCCGRLVIELVACVDETLFPAVDTMQRQRMLTLRHAECVAPCHEGHADVRFDGLGCWSWVLPRHAEFVHTVPLAMTGLPRTRRRCSLVGALISGISCADICLSRAKPSTRHRRILGIDYS